MGYMGRKRIPEWIINIEWTKYYDSRYEIGQIVIRATRTVLYK